MPDKPFLHATMLDQLFKCGVQFQRRSGYLFDVWHKKEIIRPNIPMAVGTAVHKSIQLNLSHKIETGLLLPIDSVSQSARDSFAIAWESGLAFSPEEELDGDKTFGTAVDQAVALSALHYREAAPNIEPKAVERYFELELEGFPFDLAGTMDVIEESQFGDTKTRSRMPNDGDILTVQFGVYSIAFQSLSNRMPDDIYMDALVKTDPPTYVRISLGGQPKHLIEMTLRRIERAAELITAVKEGRQAFAPADPGSWICSARWCGYHKTCPFWSGR